MSEREHTFLFADLAGFTALTEAHGDVQAAELAEEFCAAVRDLLPDQGAQEVKTIGDAVMVRVDEPPRAVALALQITAGVGAQHGFPSVRIGMHTGPAVERGGDWFGAAVNTAARVAGLARGGEVLITEATARATTESDGIELQEQGRHSLKNVAEPVLVYRAASKGQAEAVDMPVDPVCRMAVDPAHSAGTLTHEGVEYRFCSIACARAFTQAPERYVDDGAGAQRGDLSPGRQAALLGRALALAQGAGYLGSGLWNLLGRRHYRRVHDLNGDAWILNAHGAWLTLVGVALIASGLRRGPTPPEMARLGLASAIALAANDALLRRRIADIYRLDLAGESALALGWALAIRARR